MFVPYLFVVSVHVILCILLVLVILLQPGKGGDVGAAFGGGGGGGGGQVFGPRGPAGLLARATTGVAVAFMVTSITLSYYSNKSVRSDADIGDVIEQLEEEREAAEPASDPASEAPPVEE